MSTLLQLLANYYESVIECERIYYENVKCDRNHTDLAQRDSLLVKETMSLQRQITQLSSECNMQKRENERIKQLHKTQIALLESKLDNARNNVTKPRTPERATHSNRETDTKTVHLLSPISKKTQKIKAGGKDLGAASAADLSSAGQNNGLRNAIYKNKPTLFDEDSRDLAENSHEVSFVTSIKDRDKLASIVLPKDSMESSSDLDDDEINKKDVEKSPKVEQKQKKRRLIKKRIQRVDTDSEHF